jgi:hypothetical protein
MELCVIGGYQTPLRLDNEQPTTSSLGMSNWEYFETLVDGRDAARTDSPPCSPSVAPPSKLPPSVLEVFESTSAAPSADSLSLFDKLRQIQGQLDDLVPELSSAQTPPLLVAQAASLAQRLQQALKTGDVARFAAQLTSPPLMTALASTSFSSSEYAKLEQRVARLEQAVFAANFGRVDGSTSSLVDTVQKLEAKIALMDEDTVQAATRRARALGDELQRLQKQDADAPPAALLRVDDMYERLERLDAISSTVPVLTARLKSLQAVHQAAALHSVQLHGVESALQELRSQADLDRAVLGRVELGLQENLRAMQANAQVMRARGSPM